MYTYPQYQSPAQSVCPPPALENMNCVMDPKEGRGALYLGDYVSTMRSDLLLQHNIGAILSVATESKYNKTHDPRTQHIVNKHILAYDMPTYDISQHFEECNDWIQRYLSQGVNVLVHCRAGMSRSASIVIAYMMKKTNNTFDQVYTHVKGRRPIVEPNDGFKNCLRQYEAVLIRSCGSVPSSLLYSMESSRVMNQILKKSGVRPTSAFRKSRTVGNGSILENPEMMVGFNHLQSENDLRKSNALKSSQNLLGGERQMIPATQSVMYHHYPNGQPQMKGYQQPVLVQPQSLYQSMAYQPQMQQQSGPYLQYYNPQSMPMRY